MTHDIKSNKLAEQIHVCLLRPKGSMNVGAVARAMSNLGFSNLSLIAPRAFSLPEALGTACWGGEIIRGASTYNSFQDAISEMQDVVGFTSAYGKNRVGHLSVDEWLATLDLKQLPRTALLFGPEETGLQNEDLAGCRVLVRIPSALENPSYNLAQAVLLVLYEIAKLSATFDNENITDNLEGSDRALLREFDQLDQIIDQLGERSLFYGPGTSEAVRRLLKNIFRRTAPSEREMKILLGFFVRISKTIPE